MVQTAKALTIAPLGEMSISCCMRCWRDQYLPTNALVLLHLDAIHHEQRLAQSSSCYSLLIDVVARLSMLAGLIEVKYRPVLGSQMSSIWKHELRQSTVHKPNVSIIRTNRQPQYSLFICPSRRRVLKGQGSALIDIELGQEYVLDKIFFIAVYAMLRTLLCAECQLFIIASLGGEWRC